MNTYTVNQVKEAAQKAQECWFGSSENEQEIKEAVQWIAENPRCVCISTKKDITDGIFELAYKLADKNS